MEGGNSVASGGGKPAGGRSKTPGIPTTTRLQRNLAEKERRDKLNGFISELATLVPMVSNASKPLDKVSILRLAAAEMRLHFSCLNPKKYKSKPLTLPPAIMASLDLIEKTTGGFIIVTTLTGLIVFCSRSIEDYLGYQNIDVMGNKVVKYIYEDDVKYFEAKMNSVVNSLKKGSKKKTKVIKAHMLQKPLPRSNESSRPRNMIFKISVHQNDTSENGGNGSSSQSSGILKKSRPPRDFGYSAVVLMFIEPVRLEPEIDITYIDSNQDVYFTRHGLQGEIIYADQRISSITGYMPHDVQGTSAYQYICSSDVPIALFAQKAMFTSNDGKGVIVYRLRIRDMRFIYLQSSGQIAYKESSNEISHFVCFNRLLSEEEGSQELKKFQQRYAPQIMAAKMLQVKQNNVGGQFQTTDLALEQALTLINSSVMPSIVSPVDRISPFQCSKVSSPEVGSGTSDPMLSSDDFVSPSSSMAANSVHSSEGHSMISPVSNERSNSVTSEYSGYTSEQLDFKVDRPEQGGPLTDSNSFASIPYEPLSIRNNKSLGQEQLENSKKGFDNPLAVNKSCPSENTQNTNGSYRIQQNTPCVNIKSQIMHSVNAYNCLQNSIVVRGSSEETLNDHPMDLNFDHSVLQKNTSFNCNTAPSTRNVFAGQSNGLVAAENDHQNEYPRYNGQDTKENHYFVNSQNNLQLPLARAAIPSILRDHHLNFNGEQIPRNRLSHSHDLPSFSGMYEASSVSSLPKNSNKQLSVVSDSSDAVEYCPSVNSYQENGSYSSTYSPSSVSSYNNGANVTACNGPDVFNSKTFSTNSCEMNGFRVPVTSVDAFANFTGVDSFDPMDTSVEMTSVNLSSDNSLEKKALFGRVDFSGTVNVKPPMAAYQNGSIDAYSNIDGPEIAPANWTNIHSDPIANVDLTLNKELYQELDLFFQNLPQSNTSQDSGFTEPVSEFSVASSSYPQNSISSSRAKTNYHQ